MTVSGSAWNAIMQYSFIKVFATDGIIDAAELAMLERLALEDGQVDDAERAVLGKVFARVDLDSMAPEVRAEIERFKAAHAIT
jgi:hypothetical protein